MPSILSLKGKGLKLETKADIDPWLLETDPTTLEEIYLSGNTLGVDASLALAEFLQKTTVLKIADFSDIFTGRLISEIPLALTAICDSLKDKTSLIEINLSDNAFGGRSVEPMIPFLTHNRSFQILKLNNNGLGPAGGEAIASALLESANLSKAEGKKSNLKTVICGRNRLENGSASKWAEAFAAHETLVEVKMPQNGIRMEGMTALAKGLAKCIALESIDMQDNCFSDEGSTTGNEAWNEALRSWPNLTTLNLSDCVLSTEGEIPLIIEGLAEGSNPKLHTLQLQNNNMDTTSYSLLSTALDKHLSKLMMLDLQDNDVDEDDEVLQTLSSSMKKRGGKFLATDEDAEEEEQKEEEEEEIEEEKAAANEEPKAPTIADKAADALADLLDKVKIG